MDSLTEEDWHNVFLDYARYVRDGRLSIVGDDPRFKEYVESKPDEKEFHTRRHLVTMELRRRFHEGFEVSLLISDGKVAESIVTRASEAAIKHT